MKSQYLITKGLKHTLFLMAVEKDGPNIEPPAKKSFDNCYTIEKNEKEKYCLHFWYNAPDKSTKMVRTELSDGYLIK